MRTIAQVLLVVVATISCFALADAAIGTLHWTDVLKILVFPAATIPMSRRVRGEALFVWLFMAGAIVLAKLLVEWMPVTALRVAYGIVLCALGWLVKRREAPERANSVRHKADPSE